jgi:hypothetical protein
LSLKNKKSKGKHQKQMQLQVPTKKTNFNGKTLHLPIVVNAISTRVLVQFFSLSLFFAFFSHIVMFAPMLASYPIGWVRIK